MIPPTEFYPESRESIWILFDLRNSEERRLFRALQSVWGEHSDVAELGPNHMILILYPGVPSERAA
jgi:hypothetical protein